MLHYRENSSAVLASRFSEPLTFLRRRADVTANAILWRGGFPEFKASECCIPTPRTT